MEAKSTGRYIRVAPRKARVVADLIRGKYVDEAQEQLRFCQKGASDVVSKVLGSAIANAVNNFGAKSDSLYVKEALRKPRTESEALETSRDGASNQN